MFTAHWMVGATKLSSGKTNDKRQTFIETGLTLTNAYEKGLCWSLCMKGRQYIEGTKQKLSDNFLQTTYIEKDNSLTIKIYG